ncbi:MAG: hypothetical protein ABSD98_05425 [Candidatus Korobacteraceae bacterium]|jgi:20S proteasome alpha/beta subunit
MTIAIGILATDGIVIAADREESDGYLKHDRGKIFQTFRGRTPTGSIALTGAGDGPSLDGVCNLLANTFSAEHDIGSDAAEKALVDAHRKYYEETILPFSLQPQLERPDYSLVIGCVGGGLAGSRLFRTSKLGFNSSGDYEAVGVGESVANTWLNKLYDRLPIRHAVKLAAYVIYQVKASVGSCGLGTDIAIVRRDRILEAATPGTVRKWEDAFRYYQTVERNVFHYCIGVDDTAQLGRTEIGRESITSQLDNLRKMFMPSIPQKSEGQQ